MKRYGYHRTSTKERHLDRGIAEITAYCSAVMGLDEPAIYDNEYYQRMGANLDKFEMKEMKNLFDSVKNFSLSQSKYCCVFIRSIFINSSLLFLRSKFFLQKFISKL